MIIVISLLFALVGFLLYFVSGHPKIAEIGRMTYFAGILVFLMHIADKAITLLK